MKRIAAPRPAVIWLTLVALTILSVLLAERAHWHTLTIVAMFVIAAAKGELVIAHYMEIGRAMPHWRVAYRLWLVAVAILLAIGHLLG